MSTITTLSFLAAPLAMVAHVAAADAPAPPITLQVYHADGNSFNVNATLVSGKHEAVLLDTGFTRADALRIVSMVLDSRKTLTTIYISQADPDFYFGLDTVRQSFPAAKVVATASTLKKIQASWQGKIAFWGPKLGANAPQTVPMPEALPGSTIKLEDQMLEIRGLDDALPHRSYVWIPSIQAIAGGVNLFAGLHVWTADTQTVQERAAWIAKLDGMSALHPRVVVPGHASAGASQDASQIAFTREYLRSFDVELAKAANAAALIAAMQAAYPDAGLGIALDIGAKVSKGEMAW